MSNESGPVNLSRLVLFLAINPSPSGASEGTITFFWSARELIIMCNLSILNEETALGEMSKISNEYARSLKPGEQNEVRSDDDAIVV